ncbi:MAG: hypothetical protein ACRDBG_22260 [Waterburya sp.]
MHRQVLLDTGSLVALLNRRDNFHINDCDFETRLNGYLDKIVSDLNFT